MGQAAFFFWGVEISYDANSISGLGENEAKRWISFSSSLFYASVGVARSVRGLQEFLRALQTLLRSRDRKGSTV